MEEAEGHIFQTILNDIIQLIEVKESLTDKLRQSIEKNERNESRASSLSTELDDYFQPCCAAFDENAGDDNEGFKVLITQCDACKIRESLYWRRVARRLIVCNSCFFKKTYLILFNDDTIKRFVNFCCILNTNRVKNNFFSLKKYNFKRFYP